MYQFTGLSAVGGWVPVYDESDGTGMWSTSNGAGLNVTSETFRAASANRRQNPLPQHMLDWLWWWFLLLVSAAEGPTFSLCLSLWQICGSAHSPKQVSLLLKRNTPIKETQDNRDGYRIMQVVANVQSQVSKETHSSEHLFCSHTSFLYYFLFLYKFSVLYHSKRIGK